MKAAAIILCFAATAWCVPNITHPDWIKYKAKHNKTYQSVEVEKAKLKIFLQCNQTITRHNRLFKAGKYTYHLRRNKFSDLTFDEFSVKNGYKKVKLDRRRFGTNISATSATSNLTTPTTSKPTTPTTSKTTTPTTFKLTTPTTSKPTTPTTSKPTTPTTSKPTTPTTSKPTTPTTSKPITTQPSTSSVATQPSTSGFNTSFDWRTKGAVTPVKNQGRCGSCYTFAATGAIEGLNFLRTGNLVNLSEQNLLDCDTYDSGCNGGAMQNAFQYVIDNNGIDTEASYPYIGKAGNCRFQRSAVGVRISDYVNLPEGNENALKVAVKNKGPVAAAIDVRDKAFMSYGGGIWTDPTCNSNNVNHGILIVGYGTENGMDYWLVKNSWGKGWGIGGYFKIARNKNNMCGIASDACYPVN